jgi:ion channel POLLUX/CASTOR
MARKVRFRARLRYWFDNTMSRGTSSLVGWLALISLALIVGFSVAMHAVNPAGGSHNLLLGYPPNRRTIRPIYLN